MSSCHHPKNPLTLKIESKAMLMYNYNYISLVVCVAPEHEHLIIPSHPKLFVHRTNALLLLLIPLYYIALLSLYTAKKHETHRLILFFM
jgi:hypothetical protein